MKYYSTNGRVSDVSLEEAVARGLASDKGLYMPREIKPAQPAVVPATAKVGKKGKKRR